jgi:hypothetical protein
MELIQQLNEVVKDKDGIERPKLHRVIKNLITQATTAADEYDEDGNLVKEGAGDLAAIREIFDRLEGKPRQQITGPSRARISSILLCASSGSPLTVRAATARRGASSWIGNWAPWQLAHVVMSRFSWGFRRRRFALERELTRPWAARYPTTC